MICEEQMSHIIVTRVFAVVIARSSLCPSFLALHSSAVGGSKSLSIMLASDINTMLAPTRRVETDTNPKCQRRSDMQLQELPHLCFSWQITWTTSVPCMLQQLWGTLHMSGHSLRFPSSRSLLISPEAQHQDTVMFAQSM